MLKSIAVIFFSIICVGCLSTTVYVEIGDDICLNFSTIAEISVQYIVRNETALCYRVSGNVYVIPNERPNRTFNCNGSNGLMSICITDIQEEDAGLFSLRVGVSDYRENVTLSIAAPPNIFYLRDVTPVENTDLIVPCEYTPGRPPDTIIYWTRSRDANFKQAGKVLRITNIQRGMSDIFTCTAENIYSSGKKGSDQQSVDVNVLYPPHVLPMVNLSPVEEGSNVEVDCHTTLGNPPNTVLFWTRSRDSFRVNGTTLTLTNIHHESADNYSCTAENTYPSGAKGRHSQTVNIQVLYPPYSEPIKDMFPVEGTDLTAVCKFIHGNPIQTAVYWTRSQSDNFRQNGTILTLPGIQRKASDIYTCTVENIYPSGYKGKHSQSFRIKVQYVPDLHISPEKLITAIVGQTVIMRCYVEDPELTLSYTWRKDRNSSVISATSFIVFEWIDKSDEGNYTCSASNRVGNASISASIAVQLPPLEPTQLMVVCGDIYADIVWTFTSASPINQSSLLQYAPKSSFANCSQGSQDTTNPGLFASRAENLEPSTAYEFRILTTNKHGSTYSRKLFCMTRSGFSTKSEEILGGTLGAFLALAIVIVIILIVILMRRKLPDEQKEQTFRDTYEMNTVQKIEEHFYQGTDNICTGSKEVRESADYCEGHLRQGNTGTQTQEKRKKEKYIYSFLRKKDKSNFVENNHNIYVLYMNCVEFNFCTCIQLFTFC
ncbi:hemicentin-2-like [Saccostrea echinata]|uniref:hemicentin-2-like n=1 Tax=Saccostrea echinata TaxID=191078 RepID=UPI002A801978|nr:hemicentin-2-like [Saccostrea echinata]